MRTFLVTHDDLDGYACAVVNYNMLKNVSAQQIFCDYSDVDSRVSEFLDTVESDSERVNLVISDICPNRDVCARIEQLCQRDRFALLLLCDHHTSTEWVTRYVWAFNDIRLCGATLLLRRLADLDPRGLVHHPTEELENFVLAVETYDNWILGAPQRPRGEDLNRLLRFIGPDEFVRVFSEAPDADDNPDEPYMMIAECLRDAEKRHVGEAVSAIQPGNFLKDRSGNTFALLFGTRYASKVCHAMLNMYKELDWVLFVNPIQNKCDLRSRENGVDVSEIAQKVGGGGRAATAGFQVPFTKILRALLEGFF